MPLYLPPLTRRRFLASAIATLASAQLGHADDGDPNAVALFADTHIAADRAKVAQGVNLAEHLTAAIRDATALPRRPAAGLIVGDLALKDGQAGDYATLGELLKPLRAAGVPLHLTLGNHDHRDRFVAALAGSGGRPAGGRTAAVVALPRANLFILDTLDITDAVPGRLGAEQLGWLAKALDARTDRPAIVFGHHNPMFEPPPPGEKPHALLDTGELFKVLEPRRHVKAYVYGHLHQWSVKRHASGIHLVNLPAVAYVFAEGQTSGWVHAAFGESGAKLEVRCLDKTHKFHGQVADLTWRT
jgi:hypothetical protein